jgi:hypothetical protein
MLVVSTGDDETAEVVGTGVVVAERIGIVSVGEVLTFLDRAVCCS